MSFRPGPGGTSGGGGGGGEPSGPAGGDLAGTYPNPTIGSGKVTAVKIAAAVAGAGLTGGAGSALAVGAGDGVTVNANDVAAKVSDFAGTGLEDDGSNNLRIAAAAAGAGLTGGAGSALAVGAGDGITVNANDIAVSVAAIAGTGLEDDGSNNLRIAAAAAGAGLTGGAGSALAVGAGTGIIVNANDVAADFGTGAGKVAEGNDARLSDDRTASGLRTATTVVGVSAATAPTVGQVLTATSGTAATWQDPAGSGAPADAAYLTLGGVAGLSAEVNIQALSSALTFAIDDATTNAVTDVATLRHTTSGTAADGIGAGLLFESEDAAGNVESVARISAVLTTAANGTEAGALDLESRTAGGALTRRMRVHGTGGVSVGSTLDPGAGNVGVPDGCGFYGQFGGVTKNLVLCSGNVILFGNTSSSSTFHSPTGYQFKQSNTATFLDVMTSSITYGTGDNDPASDVDLLIRKAPLTGTNIAGKKLTIRGQIGTGTGASGTLVFEGGEVGTSGTTAHVVRELLRLVLSTTDDESCAVLAMREGGAFVAKRVKQGATGSGSIASHRMLQVPD